MQPHSDVKQNKTKPVVPNKHEKFGDPRLTFLEIFHLKPSEAALSNVICTSITASRKYLVTSYGVRLFSTSVRIYVST